MPFRLRTFDPTSEARPKTFLLTREEMQAEAPYGDQILAFFEQDPNLKEISLCFDSFFAVEVTRVSRLSDAPRYVKGALEEALPHRSNNNSA